MSSRVTQRVPLLGAGRHTHPRHGGCLLELVGALIGGPWTDRPLVMDPLLGQLVRSVNDLSSDDERPALAQAAPWLAHLHQGRGRDGRQVVLTAVINAALPLIQDPHGRDALLLAQHKVDDSLAGRLASVGSDHRQNRAAARAVSSAAKAVGTAQGDAGLRRLLFDVVTVLRRQCDLTSMPPMDRPAALCRITVPLVGEIRAPGGDGMYCRWTALVEEWPHWMKEVTIETSLSPNQHGVSPDRASLRQN